MEEILNKLIDADLECQRALNQLKQKQQNIEYFINDELEKRKDEIKAKYKFKIDMRKHEYDVKLAENLQEIEQQKQKQMEKMKANYETEQQNVIDKIVKSIMEEK